MAIEEGHWYRVACDCCGYYYGNCSGRTAQKAIENAVKSGYVLRGTKWLCPECVLREVEMYVVSLGDQGEGEALSCQK